MDHDDIDYEKQSLQTFKHKRMFYRSLFEIDKIAILTLSDYRQCSIPVETFHMF